MFILKHGTKEEKPYLRAVTIGVTGIDISFSERKGSYSVCLSCGRNAGSQIT